MGMMGVTGVWVWLLAGWGLICHRWCMRLLDKVELVPQGLFFEVEEAGVGDVLQVPVAQVIQNGLVIHCHIEVVAPQGKCLDFSRA